MNTGTLSIKVLGSAMTIDLEWNDGMKGLPPGEYPLAVEELGRSIQAGIDSVYSAMGWAPKQAPQAVPAQKHAPSPGFEVPPYRVEVFPAGAAVMNANGINCLHFPEAPGAKFTSLENATQIAAEWNSLAAQAPQAAPAPQPVREPVWIVNDLGELGVQVGGRFFFLYKGDSIEYGVDSIGEVRDGVALHDDGSPIKYRIVGKREFGETCWPLKWVTQGRREDRYTEELVFIPGLSFGEPEDGAWRELPAPQPEAGQHPDDKAVDRFAARMKWKLAQKRNQGRDGWQDRAWSPEQISLALREHVGKGDPLDVANYCMFLAARNEPIATAPAPQALTPEHIEATHQSAATLTDFARAIEQACAEKWGVKLASAGAGTKP